MKESAIERLDHMKVRRLKAFEDNYIWCLEVAAQVIVVDPGQAQPVLTYLKETQKQPVAILITHNHEDHYGGLKEILSHYKGIPVYGPQEVASLVTHLIKEGDHLTLLDRDFTILKTAGHSPEHISYYTPGHLFCGDALFSAGCGRVFTRDYEAAFQGLQKIKALPTDTLLYGGHEYTLTNLDFALSQVADKEKYQNYRQQVQTQLEQGQASLPTRLDQEMQINLFLQADNLAEFTRLRLARDQF